MHEEQSPRSPALPRWWRTWDKVLVIAIGLFLVALQIWQLRAIPSAYVDILRWVTLVAGVVLILATVAQIAIERRRRSSGRTRDSQ